MASTMFPASIDRSERSTNAGVRPQGVPSIEQEIGSWAEALFEEARRRRRRRWLIVLTTLAVIGIALGLRISFGGAPPQRSGGRMRSGDSGASSPAAGHFVLKGNGIGTARFGQRESVAITDLKEELGRPRSSAPVPSDNCTIDSYLQWSTMTAFFDHQRFVGYATGSLIGGPGYREIPDLATLAGLRIGDTLADARRKYGAALTTSREQGGAWSTTTPTGTLGGNLTSEVSRSTPQPRIADVTAGSVGCRASAP